MTKRSSGGGGPGSRVVTQQPVRTGQPAREINPRGVSQIGSQMGNKATNSGKILKGAVEPVRGQRMPSVPLGNETALSKTRAVYGTGTQGQHGPVAGKVAPQGRDILSAFGPDSASVKERKNG